MKTKRLRILPAIAIFLCTTAHSQTTWVKHSGNPVVPAPSGYAAEPAVIFNSSLERGFNNTSEITDPLWAAPSMRSAPPNFQNYALSFDGVDDVAGLPSNFISTPTAITMEAWVKYNSNQTHMQALSVEGTYAFFLNRFEAGTFTPFFDGSTNNGNDFGYGANLNDNQWHHLAAVHAQGTTKIFVDGVLVGSANESLYDINSLNRTSAIGAQFDGSVFHFEGLVDEVRVWNIARTAGEIQADMNHSLAGNETGLIGYWRCDEGVGQILHDASPSVNHGQLGLSSQDDAADPQWVLAESDADNQDNFALNFLGSNDFVGLPSNFISTPTAITMEAWVKYSSSQPHMQAVSVEGAYAFFLNRVEVGTFTPFFDGSTNNGNDFGYGANLNDNQWHHLAAVHAQGTLKVFVDGALVGSVNESLYDINSLDRAAAIGAQFDGSEFHFDGLVDEVRVWNIARTPGEIQADMHRRLAGNETGLIGYWRCDEGEGQILHDASPSEKHGQLGFSPQDDDADPQWVSANRNVTGCQGIPLPASEAYGNINAGNRSHPDKATYCFEGQTGNLYLSFQAFDIDTNQEVDVLLNGVEIFDVPLTANNSWSGLLGVLLPDELIHDDNDNELIFDNTRNPPQSLIWGVRQVSIVPFFALPSAAAYGKIPGGDQAHADKVVYLFSGRPGDLNLIHEVYDIDDVNELDVLLNGAKIHDEGRTANNTWSKPRALRLPDALVNDAGLNVLIFDSPGNPPRQWYWGVRNVRVQAAPHSSIALELSQSRIAEANMARDGQYLFDGRSTPPARSETDDDAVIDGATIIAPNGHLVVDLQTVRQFDYLQLYPEWNTQRYFTYRVEASQNGKDWQTVIDKSASFVHGIQLDELPTTQARFLRIRGASFMADVDALSAAELSEEAYWQTHDDLINRADSTDLAIAELALFQKHPQVNVVSDANSPPVLYDLAQNFPNPFNPVTTIKFALPRPAKVKLAVYDLRGAIVRILEEGELPAGFHARTFDTAGLASGIYLYKLQAGEFTATRKMVLVK